MFVSVACTIRNGVAVVGLLATAGAPLCRFVCPLHGFSGHCSGFRRCSSFIMKHVAGRAWAAATPVLGMVAGQKTLRLLLSLSLFSVPGIVAQRPGAEDPLIASVVMASEVNCDCSCCQVVERLPSEVVVLPTGQELRHQCAMPLRSAQDQAAIPQCPSQCASDEGELDYNVFCKDSCHPSTSTVGSMCEALTFDSMLRPAVRPTGQRVVYARPGSAVYTASAAGAGALPAAGLGSQNPQDMDLAARAAWEAAMEEQYEIRAEEQAAAQAAAEKSAAEKAAAAEVVLDLRPLVAGRLRAEAAAANSASSMSAEQVRSATYAVKRNAALLGHLRGTVPAAQSSLSGETALAEANATAAAEAAIQAEQVVAEAEKSAPHLLPEIRNLAIQEIHMKAAVAAQAAARAFARRMHWDRPNAYGRVVAYRAGEPFAQEAAKALQRQSEYQARATEYQQQADAEKLKAEAAYKHVGVAYAMGDRLGAMANGEQAAGFLRHAHYVEAQAAAAREGADQAMHSSAAWQQASADAVAHAAQRYYAFQATTPAPETPPPGAIQVGGMYYETQSTSPPPETTTRKGSR